jgi:hypothetical protein
MAAEYLVALRKGSYYFNTLKNGESKVLIHNIPTERSVVVSTDESGTGITMGKSVLARVFVHREGGTIDLNKMVFKSKDGSGMFMLRGETYYINNDEALKLSISGFGKRVNCGELFTVFLRNGMSGGEWMGKMGFARYNGQPIGE